MSSKWKVDVEILEQGDVYFFYKPKKGIKNVTGFTDIARFYIVLDSFDKPPPRFVVIGKKRLPAIFDGNETAWGYVEKVGGRGFQAKAQDNAKIAATAARPVGEGIYAIIKHGDHSHLVYELELPRVLGVAQKTLNIKKEGNYVLVTKEEGADGKFKAYQGGDALQNEGQELLLIGTSDAISHLGISAGKEQETLKTADIFTKLKMSKKLHKVEPLMQGTLE